MGFRFYRRVRLFPGVSVNLSRSGPSLSVGIRGAHMTVGRRGVTKTVGIPGTGLLYTSRQGYHSGIHSAHNVASPPPAGIPGTPPPTEEAGRGVLIVVILGLLLCIAILLSR